uniref:Uncharacterized protein n=1 Tax=Eutreptiella gymnastica TaxID=73025 RepID=A0A7S4GEF3_9EUGL
MMCSVQKHNLPADSKRIPMLQEYRCMLLQWRLSATLHSLAKKFPQWCEYATGPTRVFQKCKAHRKSGNAERLCVWLASTNLGRGNCTGMQHAHLKGTHRPQPKMGEPSNHNRSED